MNYLRFATNNSNMKSNYKPSGIVVLLFATLDNSHQHNKTSSPWNFDMYSKYVDVLDSCLSKGVDYFSSCVAKINNKVTCSLTFREELQTTSHCFCMAFNSGGMQSIDIIRCRFKVSILMLLFSV